MTSPIRLIRTALMALLASFAIAGVAPAAAATGAAIDEDVQAGLAALYKESPTAAALGQKAKGILVFPSMVKAGFVVGAQRGEGALLKGGKTVGYYSSSALSVGMQAGAQSYAYAIFFMSDAVMKSFEKSNGFEVGVGPSVVIVDTGAAKDINTLTAKSDVYAFVFGQQGMMAGVGLQGTKITRISR
ncbi:MAG: hypothetical protein RIS35_2691 [Pseudomonadota bacterium]|jgi:lipid-binding SYLF domain-containing protein